MKRTLLVLIPLSVAALLSTLFIVLLLRETHRDEKPLGAPQDVARGPAEDRPAEGMRTGLDIPIPQSDPSAPDPWAERKIERHPGRFSRWNLGELPEGWDPELAQRLHDLFDRIEFTHLDDAETLDRVAKSMEEIKKLLAGLGPEALPTLGKILNVEPDFVARRRLLEGIGRLGPKSDEATWILRDYYMARYDDPRYRSEIGHVVKAMGELKNDTAFEQLRYLSEHEEHQLYRDKLLVELGNHPRRAEAIDVFDRALSDPNFHARNKAAQALGKVATTETLDSLVRAFLDEPVFYAQQTILGSIGKVGSPEAIPFLEEQARLAEKSDVRLSAASAIRRIVEKTGDRYGRAVLDELVETEPDPGVRRYIERWIKDLSAGGKNS